MRVTFDRQVDMGYIQLVDRIAPGEAARQLIVDDGDSMMAFVLDVDAQGRLLGIEVFGAGRRLHPDLLALVDRPDQHRPGQDRPDADRPAG